MSQDRSQPRRQQSSRPEDHQSAYHHLRPGYSSIDPLNITQSVLEPIQQEKKARHKSTASPRPPHHSQTRSTPEVQQDDQFVLDGYHKSLQERERDGKPSLSLQRSVEQQGYIHRYRDPTEFKIPEDFEGKRQPHIRRIKKTSRGRRANKAELGASITRRIVHMLLSDRRCP